MNMQLKSPTAIAIAIISLSCVSFARAFTKQPSTFSGGTRTRITTTHNTLPATRQVSRHGEEGCSNFGLEEKCSEPFNPSQLGSCSSRRQVLYKVTTMAVAGAATTAILEQQPANAISADEASRSYDAYAPTYDELDGGSAASALGIDDARSSLLSKARGHVLEVGVGTGLNVNRYHFAGLEDGDGEGVTALTLVDISDGMLNEARAKISKLGLPSNIKVEFVRADATKDLADRFGRGVFDTVVDTFSLCVMGNDGAGDCLAQLRDVVKSADQGGQILLIENTRSSNPLLGLYQDATAKKASQMGGKGCVYNQDVTAMLTNTRGLDILHEEAFAAGLFRSFEVVRKD